MYWCDHSDLRSSNSSFQVNKKAKKLEQKGKTPKYCLHLSWACKIMTIEFPYFILTWIRILGFVSWYNGSGSDLIPRKNISITFFYLKYISPTKEILHDFGWFVATQIRLTETLLLMEMIKSAWALDKSYGWLFSKQIMVFKRFRDRKMKSVCTLPGSQLMTVGR